jgi:hypothetical protein
MRNIIIFHPLYTVVFEKQRSKSGVEDELSMHVVDFLSEKRRHLKFYSRFFKLILTLAKSQLAFTAA